MGLLGRLGIDVVGLGTEHMTEHDDLVKLNDLIISRMRMELGEDETYEKYQGNPGGWSWKPMPEGWEEWLFNTTHYEIVEEIQKVVPTLPNLLKDPRWSVTLPLFVLHSKILPDYVINLHRDPEQCASSWSVSSPVRLKDAIESIKLKDDNLDRSMMALQKRGVQCLTFEYPDYLLDTDEIIKTVNQIWRIPLEEVKTAFDKYIDKARMHEYNLKDKEGKLTKCLDPEAEEEMVYFVCNIDRQGEKKRLEDDPVMQMLKSLEE
jgi:hypothetical protein